jgi:predicted negative regulator of RcsB-dependent stress response
VHSQKLALVALFLLFSSAEAQVRGAQPRFISKGETLEIFNEMQKSSAETNELIHAVDVLLKKPIPQAQKDTLLLNRASYFLTLTKIDFLKSKNMELSSEGHKWLETAESDIHHLHALEYQSNEFKSKIFLMEGLAHLYRDESYEESFLNSIAQNPKSSSNPWTAIMLAEFYFDKAEYVTAQSFYKKYFTKLDPKQKELAIYKLAWCALNTKNYPDSEKYFIQLVEKRSKSEIAKDALKDLGYVMSLYRTDPEIIVAAAAAFKQRPEVHLSFLMTIMSYREARQELKPDSPFFAAISKMDGFPSAKFQLFLSASRSSNKGYASHEHLKAFHGVAGVYTAKLDQEARSAFILETEAIIKSFYETYSGKVKSPENWTRVELNNSLRQLIDYHLKTFPESPMMTQMIAVKTELCTQVKDYRCMIESQLHILANPKQHAFHEEATLELFKIWDELYKKDPKKYSERSIGAAERFIKAFPKSKSWELGARRLAEYHSDLNNHKAAVDVLKLTYEKFPNEENFWRLQNSRFKAAQYAELLADGGSENAPPRIIELRREAALQKAVIDKQKGDLNDYEKSISAYISTNPSEEKIRVARVDYFATLLEKSEQKRLKDEWMKLDNKEKLHQDYRKILSHLWSDFFKDGNFRDALEVVPASTDPNLHYMRLLSQMAAGEKFAFTELKTLDSEKRLYLESLLLLTEYQSLWDHFRAEPPRGEEERTLAAWAYRLSSGNMEIVKNSTSVKVLGDNFDFATPQSGFPSLRKRIAEVPVPKAGLAMKPYATLLGRALQDVRFLRKKVAYALKQMRGPEQESLSLEMSALEQKLGVAIQASPIPEKLSPEDEATYKSKLSEAAGEFVTQAEEFKKIAESSKQQRLAAELSVPSNTSWPASEEWNISKFKSVRTIASDNNIVAAILLLDLLNNESKDENKSTYYRLRFKVLRPLWEKSALMRQYLATELKRAEQLQILEEWRKVPHEV